MEGRPFVAPKIATGTILVTGTEWEFEDALKANRERKAPDLLMGVMKGRRIF